MKGRLVLIILRPHHEVMLGWIVIVLLVLAGPLAAIAGTDSRIDDVARRRRHNG